MDVYVATFLQLVVSSVVLIAIALLTARPAMLLSAPPLALLYFAIAGFFHFLIGWTFLNASQKKIGAARTSPLIGTNPLFAAVVAAVTLGELPSWLELAGIIIIVFGAYIISRESADPERSMKGSQTVLAIVSTSWLGLGAAFFWALSPIFIRLGLDGLPSPLLGVTVGVTASALAYAVILLLQPQRWLGQPITGDAWMQKLLAGLLVGLSTWMRWVALDLAPVAVVLALTLISTPLVILLSPLISGKQLERVTGVLWMGTLLIIGGALLLIFI
jgi:drug/metabolite transporter (DMT)-like permease